MKLLVSEGFAGDVTSNMWKMPNIRGLLYVCFGQVIMLKQASYKKDKFH